MTNIAFQVGGSVDSNSSIYIERKADQELYHNLLHGELCYVFNSRQMGKSSLLLNVKRRLQLDDVSCCFIDMSRIGSVNITQQQWYAGIVSELWRGFDLSPGRSMIEWWQSLGELAPSQKLIIFIEQKLIEQNPEKKFTIFFDEIDSVLSLPFAADDFFSLLRAFYNKRADDKHYEQLTFAFFGVALPSELIQDGRRSPFNIGKAISLEGFTYQEGIPLSNGIVVKNFDNKKVLQRILYWSNGQPFLTQKVCLLLSQSDSSDLYACENDWVDKVVNEGIIENWERNDNPEHLKTIRDRLLFDEQHSVQLLANFMKITEDVDGLLTIDEISGFNRLYLTGLVENLDNRVSPRNLIYKTIFNENWLQKQLNKHRPYGEKLTLWQQSSPNNDQWLLPTSELESAKSWANDKHLPEDDYKFFSASQDKISHEIKSWNRKLQSEIEQRVKAENSLKEALKALELAKTEAESANKAKSEFLTRVSHEVRTHLNSILGISYVAQQQEYHDKAYSPLNRINRVASYMHGIVNDMLDIDKLEKNQLTLKEETFYLDDVLDKLVSVVGQIVFDKGLTFNVDYPESIVPALIGDPLRLEQLLSNLLTNAIKYTEKGNITLKVKVIHFTDNDPVKPGLSNNILKVAFEVSDTGSGFGEKLIKGALHTVSSEGFQLGIGLKLCNSLSTLMHGELSVYSVPQSGTSFKFSSDFQSLLVEKNIKTLSKRVLLIDNYRIKKIEQQLALLGCDVSKCSIQSLSQVDLSSIEIVIVSFEDLSSQETLLQQIGSFPNIRLLPLIQQNEEAPHWLSIMGYKSSLNYPCSVRHLSAVLQSTKLASDPIDEPNIIHKAAPQKLNVLVVDDDEINQEIVSELLQNLGLQISFASNGVEAIKALKVKKFHLVLMDIEMPVMGGEQALVEIQKLSQQAGFSYLKSMPIVALTAHALIEDRRKYLLAGMNDYVSKPIEPSTLIKVVKQWLPENYQQESISCTAPKNKKKVDIEGVDTVSGQLRCNGNTSLYLKILRQFAQQYSRGICFEGESEENIAQLTHSIKGAAANLGAKELSEIAKITENKARAGHSINSDLLKLNKFIILTSKNIFQGISQYKTKEAGNADINKDQLQSLLSELVLAVEEDHGKAISLCEQLLQSNSSMAIDIDKAMSNFDSENVKVLCNSWIVQLS